MRLTTVLTHTPVEWSVRCQPRLTDNDLMGLPKPDGLYALSTNTSVDCNAYAKPINSYIDFSTARLPSLATIDTTYSFFRTAVLFIIFFI